MLTNIIKSKFLAQNYVCLLVVLTTNKFAAGFEQPLFFRASYFTSEPRFEKRGLSSLDIIISSGAADESRNCAGNKTPLFDLYGKHHILNTLSYTACNTIEKADLLELIQNLKQDTIAVSYDGTFRDTQIIFNYYQNIVHGIFTQLTVPSHFTKTNACPRLLLPQINEPKMVETLSELGAASGILTPQEIRKHGLGDTSFWVGYTRNYQETEYLDFIDYTFKLGGLFPTSKKGCCTPFDIPLGYNGHYGLRLAGDLSIGAYEWVTAGLNLGTIIFASQNGIEKKPLWEVGGYFKIDHTPDAFSAILGYRWNKKQQDCATTSDQTEKPVNFNALTRSSGWSMHTLHFFFEYDGARESRRAHPRISLIINIPLAGKNIFVTSMFGIDAGLDLTWSF